MHSIKSIKKLREDGAELQVFPGINFTENGPGKEQGMKKRQEIKRLFLKLKKL